MRVPVRLLIDSDCWRPMQQATRLYRAFGLLEEMRAAGLAPDLITYHTLLRLCDQAGQGHAASTLHEVRGPALCTKLPWPCTCCGHPSEQLYRFRSALCSTCCSPRCCCSSVKFGWKL